MTILEFIQQLLACKDAYGNKEVAFIDQATCREFFTKDHKLHYECFEDDPAIADTMFILLGPAAGEDSEDLY